MTTLLHQYQRGVLFSFIISLVIFVLYISLAGGKLTPNLEQILGGIWLTMYGMYCFLLRRKIPDTTRVGGLERPIVHWVLLGIGLVYFNVVKPNDFRFLYPIINLGFIVFALFSADAHWDFRK